MELIIYKKLKTKILMQNVNIPLTILFSILPTVSGLIAIYIKLKSEVIKIETELRHTKEKLTEYNCSIKQLTEKVSELNDKYMNFIIELTIKANSK